MSSFVSFLLINKLSIFSIDIYFFLVLKIVHFEKKIGVIDYLSNFTGVNILVRKEVFFHFQEMFSGSEPRTTMRIFQCSRCSHFYSTIVKSDIQRAICRNCFTRNQPISATKVNTACNIIKTKKTLCMSSYIFSFF